MSYQASNLADNLGHSRMPPGSTSQQSLLFPSLLENINSQRRLSILEIGPALPETIEFFSQYKCRLHFAAMYSDPVLKIQLEDVSERDLVEHFRSSFMFPAGTRFDICLYWDFLNYLCDKALRAFSTAIKPFIHRTTRAHAFTARTLETSIVRRQYGINQVDRFSVRPGQGAHSPRFPHTQAILVNLMTCFDIDQGMLLPDGRLEVLMSASTGSNVPRPRYGPKRTI